MAPNLDFSKIARIHPSVVIEYADGTKTTISFEWFDQNSEHVTLLGYALIILYKDGSKEELFFDSEDRMHQELQNLYEKLLQLKK